MISSAPATPALSTLLKDMAWVPPNMDRPIGGLASDSRRVNAGDLFFALRGLHHHGLEFLAAVRRAGAVAVAWEPPYDRAEILEPSNDFPLIAVDELSQRLGFIAGRFHGEPDKALQVVGITGTDGKTSCAHYIAQCLPRCGLMGTLGYGIYGHLDRASHTTPDALNLWRQLVELRHRGVSSLVMEVSSHALDQGRVNGLNFQVAVFTNLTRDHLDYHGSLQAYAAAKRRLFFDHRPRYAVVNLDDVFGRQLAGDLTDPTTTVGYTLGEAPITTEAWVQGEVTALTTAGLTVQIRSSWGKGELRAGLLGRFNASNLLAALATLLSLNVPLEEALRRLSRVSPVPGRMERFGGTAGKPLVVVDYAHTPYSLEQALRALREHGPRRLWCVFGCGGERDSGKRPLMGACAERFADQVIVTDDNPRGEASAEIIAHILEGMVHPKGIQIVPERAIAIQRALTQAGADDIVLIAGKGHEEYQLIGDERIPFSDRQQVLHWLEEANRS